MSFVSMMHGKNKRMPKSEEEIIQDATNLLDGAIEGWIDKNWKYIDEYLKIDPMEIPTGRMADAAMDVLKRDFELK